MIRPRTIDINNDKALLLEFQYEKLLVEEREMNKPLR